MHQDTPLYVDLDGTVIRTDLVYESVFALLRKNPLFIFLLPFWFLRGRPFFKREIAKRVTIDAASLPYFEDVITFLKAEKSKGRRIVLATASDEMLANEVAKHLGVFDAVLGTAGGENIKGANKLRAMIAQVGSNEFCYAGNSKADFAIWKGCKEGIVVSPSRAFIKRAEKLTKVVKVFEYKAGSFLTLLQALRVYQWVKNLLIFVPIFVAHKFTSPEIFIPGALAFFSFSFVASSVYILNDLLDLNADRLHPTKRTRPFASGALPIWSGMVLAPILLGAGVLYAQILPSGFLNVLAIYFAVTLAYSLYLKQVIVIDIVILASLYALRILAGGMAADIPVSKWLLAFAIFFFFSLACIKRYSELFSLKATNRQKPSGRGYLADDLGLIATFGSSSAYISILVLALYVNSPEVTALYSEGGRLWFLIPLLLYWTSRVWLLCSRGVINEDPIVFALTDRVSYLVGLGTLAIVLLAI